MNDESTMGRSSERPAGVAGKTAAPEKSRKGRWFWPTVMVWEIVIAIFFGGFPIWEKKAPGITGPVNAIRGAYSGPVLSDPPDRVSVASAAGIPPGEVTPMKSTVFKGVMPEGGQWLAFTPAVSREYAIPAYGPFDTSPLVRLHDATGKLLADNRKSGNPWARAGASGKGGFGTMTPDLIAGKPYLVHLLPREAARPGSDVSLKVMVFTRPIHPGEIWIFMAVLPFLLVFAALFFHVMKGRPRQEEPGN